MESMAELVWEWQLTTGERVVAKLDPSSGTETVFLGARLVSRSRRGATPGGHELRSHRVRDGAYRGATDRRVFFEGDDCRLMIDGEPMDAMVPPVDELAASARRVAVGVLGSLAGLFVFLGVIVVVEIPRAARQRDIAARAAPAASPAAPPRPLDTQTHLSSNGLVTVRYPSDLTVTDTRLDVASSVVQLTRDGGDETIELFSAATPDTTDIWRLEASIQKASERSWPAHHTFTVDVERSVGKCHGEDGAIALRHLSVRGSPVRQWSCTFVHEGHAFRFATFTPEARKADEAYLRSIVDAAAL